MSNFFPFPLQEGLQSDPLGADIYTGAGEPEWALMAGVDFHGETINIHEYLIYQNISIYKCINLLPIFFFVMAVGKLPHFCHWLVVKQRLITLTGVTL